MKKIAIIGLVLVGIMFFSSVAFAFLQSVYVPNSDQRQRQEIPQNYIVTSELSLHQENFILQNGFTIMKYFYPPACIECGDRIVFLEQLTVGSEFTNQIILEEISRDGPERLEVFSIIGGRTFEGINITVNATIDTLCEVTLNPPVGCTLRELR